MGLLIINQINLLSSNPTFNFIPFPYNLAGVFLSFTGFNIMGNSRNRFRIYDTSLAVENSTHMITDGIFRWSRNPMYFGMFVLLLGLGICFLNLFSILTPFVFFLIVNFNIIPKEKKLMESAFGVEYLDYKDKDRK